MAAKRRRSSAVQSKPVAEKPVENKLPKQCCGTCFSHRLPKGNSIYSASGGVVCHNQPTVQTKAPTFWCAQWKPIDINETSFEQAG